MSKKYNSSLYFYPNCVVFRQVLKKKTRKNLDFHKVLCIFAALLLTTKQERYEKKIIMGVGHPYLRTCNLYVNIVCKLRLACSK